MTRMECLSNITQCVVGSDRWLPNKRSRGPEDVRRCLGERGGVDDSGGALLSQSFSVERRLPVKDLKPRKVPGAFWVGEVGSMILIMMGSSLFTRPGRHRTTHLSSCEVDEAKTEFTNTSGTGFVGKEFGIEPLSTSVVWGAVLANW